MGCVVVSDDDVLPQMAETLQLMSEQIAAFDVDIIGAYKSRDGIFVVSGGGKHFQELSSFGAGCSAHIENPMMRLERLQEERRQHAHGFLPTDITSSGVVNQELMKALENSLFAQCTF